jgi:hypothetical protein
MEWGGGSAQDRMGGVAKAVAKPVRARAVPLLPVWKLANSMQWVLCWEDLEVTGPTATWVRETLQGPPAHLSGIYGGRWWLILGHDLAYMGMYVHWPCSCT